jgi:sulfite exporter TauE/SafE
MCGPVVATYSLNLGGSRRSQTGSRLPHLLYNAGRITTYSIIGGIMGVTGSFAGVVRSIGRFQDMTMAAIGMLMVVMGLATGGWLSFIRRSEGASADRKAGAFLSRSVAGMIRFISESRGPGAFYAIGVATGFIPCGLLYTAYIAAAGAGSTAASQAEGLLKGMSMLFLFGLGTAPALFLIGRIVALRSEWIRKRLYRMSALFMVLAGVILVYRSLKY